MFEEARRLYDAQMRWRPPSVVEFGVACMEAERKNIVREMREEVTKLREAQLRAAEAKNSIRCDQLSAIAGKLQRMADQIEAGGS